MILINAKVINTFFKKVALSQIFHNVLAIFFAILAIFICIQCVHNPCNPHNVLAMCLQHSQYSQFDPHVYSNNKHINVIYHM